MGQVSVPCMSATTHKNRVVLVFAVLVFVVLVFVVVVFVVLVFSVLVFVVLVFVVLGGLPQGQAWAVLSQIPTPLSAVSSATVPLSALARAPLVDKPFGMEGLWFMVGAWA